MNAKKLFRSVTIAMLVGSAILVQSQAVSAGDIPPNPKSLSKWGDIPPNPKGVGLLGDIPPNPKSVRTNGDIPPNPK